VQTLFHITTRAAWSAALAAGRYEGDTLHSEGFIHCSLAHQVVEVADRLFSGREDLLLLRVDESRVGPEVRYENLEGGDEQYPHVYGPLDLEAVTGLAALTPRADGSFALPGAADYSSVR
jgi:uncharacterized protein (DUF952 family)